MNYDIGLLLDGLILIFLCVTIFYAARLSLFMKTFRQSRGEISKLIKELNIVIGKAEGSVASMQENAGTTEVAMREVIVDAKFLSDELRFMTETGDSLADRLEKLADRNRELVDLMESAGGIGNQKIASFEPAKSVPKKMKDVSYQDSYSTREEDSFDIMDFDLDADEMDEDDEFDFMALSDGAYREEYDFEAEQERALYEESASYHKSQIDLESKSKVRSFAIFDRDHMHDHFDDELEFQQDDVYEEVDNDDQQFHSRAEQDLYDALQRKKRDFDKKVMGDK